MSPTTSSLYVCYLGISDPLVETQVVRYVEGLAAAGHRMHLLTFEPERLSRGQRATIRARLRARGIEWHRLRYHQRPSLPATAWDVLAGSVTAGWLMRRHRLDVFHARVHVPAAMAQIARRIKKHHLLFDIRGLMAEEYVDAGRWEQDGTPWKITKWVEARALRRSVAAITLTRFAASMLPQVEPAPPITVIPCCADIARFSTERSAEGGAWRERFELDADDVVMVYAGKFGGWYLQEQMADFFAAAKGLIPRLKFLVLSQDDHAHIERELQGRGVSEADYRLGAVPPEQMGEVLSAADFAISFIAPFPSKRASSPTKIGEYLAAGLPIVATAGVGDLDGQLTEAGAGVLVGWPEGDFEAAAREVATLLADEEAADRCRALAKKELSLEDVGIPRYRAVYESLARQGRP